MRERYFNKDKRLTIGLVFEHGKGVLSKDLAEAVVARAEEKDAAEKTKATKKKKKDLEAKEKIQSLRQDIQSFIHLQRVRWISTILN